MRRFLIIVFITSIIANNVFGQDSILIKCKTYEKADLKVFIHDQKDTLLSDGRKVQHINPIHLMKGFELQISDTSYKIIRFFFTFDFDEGLCQMVSKANKIIPDNESVASINKLYQAHLITIDGIIIEKNGVCYKIPSLVYYPFKK